MDKKAKHRFSFRSRLRSFKYAFQGFAWLFRFEHNARIHLGALILVIIAGFTFHISDIEWALVIIVSAFVFTAEAFNSALEFLADEVSLEQQDKIGKAKDLAATGVLIAAIAAVVLAAIIFIPKILLLIN